MRNKQAGFNLIEVMISFVLIGVGALGLVKLQTYIEQRADYALHSVAALNLAEQKLEWFRTRGSSSVSAALPSADFASSIVAGQDLSHPLYHLSWSVPAVELAGELKSIEIEARWQDRHGTAQSVTLHTMISQHSEFD
ncbi:type IV pilus modification PilV family protein [Vibrio misgurnus]|uniref:type IV pilus modification PilV family protein n=1 Tax=Vibrio TaxID=662 RepID=UPI002416B840|nr:prepilin-type N-terminal cleavage/methylation domain-containing protein [Vibrio sp. gvc]